MVSLRRLRLETLGSQRISRVPSLEFFKRRPDAESEHGAVPVHGVECFHPLFAVELETSVESHEQTQVLIYGPPIVATRTLRLSCDAVHGVQRHEKHVVASERDVAVIGEAALSGIANASHTVDANVAPQTLAQVIHCLLPKHAHRLQVGVNTVHQLSFRRGFLELVDHQMKAEIVSALRLMDRAGGNIRDGLGNLLPPKQFSQSTLFF